MRERIYSVERLKELKDTHKTEGLIYNQSQSIFRGVTARRGYWILYDEHLNFFISGMLPLDRYHILLGEPI